MNEKRTDFPVWPLIFSFIGFCFAVWNSIDTHALPCLGSGCTLYSTFNIGGLSLWWFGIVAFVLLFLLALFRKMRLGLVTAGVGVFLDCILLVVMLLTSPCLSCLVIAFFFAATYLAFLLHFELQIGGQNRESRRFFSGMLCIWSVLFITNIGFVGRSFSSPWSIVAPAETSVSAQAHVYFSLHCGACRQLILGIPEAEARKMAWYPVAEEEGDVLAVQHMQSALEEGLSLLEAYQKAQESKNFSVFNIQQVLQTLTPEALLLQVRLWINQAHVVTYGGAQLPFVEFRGLPSALLRQPPQSVRYRPNLDSDPLATDLPFLNIESAGACTENAPCPE